MHATFPTHIFCDLITLIIIVVEYNSPITQFTFSVLTCGLEYTEHRPLSLFFKLLRHRFIKLYFNGDTIIRFEQDPKNELMQFCQGHDGPYCPFLYRFLRSVEHYK